MDRREFWRWLATAGTHIAGATVVLAQAPGRGPDRLEAVVRARFGREVGDLCAVALSPDGSLVAATGLDPAAMPVVDLRSLDGSGRPPRIWFAAGKPPRLRLYEAATGRALRSFEHPASIYAIAFSPDGSRIAAAGVAEYVPAYDPIKANLVRRSVGGRELGVKHGGGLVKVWEVSTGREVRALTGHRRPVKAVGYGRFIASLDQANILKLWKPDSGEEFLEMKGPHEDKETGRPRLPAAVFSRNALRAIGGGALWEGSAGRPRAVHLVGDDPVEPLAIRPDGKRFATWSQHHAPLVWDFDTQRMLTRGEARPGQEAEVLAFSPDGGRLAAIGEDGRLVLWDADSGHLLATSEGPRGHVRAVAFLPDGTVRVVSGGWSMTDPAEKAKEGDPLVLWDARPR